MSKAVKGIGKVFKSVGKVVKKVVKKAVDIGKKIVKGVGKVMGKLGPIGTIAIGFLAPYAIGALASSSIGWVSSIGQGLQAVSSAVAAPFKIAGQAIGKGISTFGGSIGQAIGGQAGSAFTSLTDKVSGFLGYSGGSISDGAASIMDSVKGQWNEAFGTSFQTASPVDKVLDLGKVVGSGTGSPVNAPFGGEDAASIDLFKDAPIQSGTQISTDPAKMSNIFGVEGPYDTFDPSQANPFDKNYSAQELSGIDPAKQVPDAQYTMDKSSGFKMPSLGGLSGLGGGIPAPTPLDNSGYALSSAEAGASGGSRGGTGSSFFAQDKTGLLLTEDLIKQQNSLLGRVA